jgi:hypothetical protein
MILKVRATWLVRAISACILASMMVGPVQAQQASPELSASEQAVCRSDAIKFCFFSLANADWVRACLRKNKPSLSTPCQKLLTSRGN